MEGKTAWHSYQLWHDLLDAVCVEQGHLDNMALASELSAASGHRSGEAFEAALKNLRNWRSGAHLPQRRNFILLAKVLRVDSYDGLKEHWAHLYSQARREAGRETVPSATTPPRWAWSPVTILATLAVLMVGTGYLLKSSLTVLAQDREAADVEYRQAVSVNVGEAVVVHGARGSCHEDPPTWEKVRAKLPALELGFWSDGAVGTRYSRKCGGPTPARGIVFNATRSGQAEVTVFGDPVKIEVK